MYKIQEGWDCEWGSGGGGCSFLLITYCIFKGYNNQPTMRSKQRRTYKQSQSPSTPLTPNPHLKYHPASPERTQRPSPARLLQQSAVGGERGRLEALMRENNELKKEIVELKVHQFYHFDDGKLKQLIQELEALRKEVKKHQLAITDLQLENDFLRRTNAHLKLELQKDIQARTKEAYSQDLSKCTLPRQNLNRSSDDELTHLGSSSHFNSTTLTLEDNPDPHPHPPRNDSRLSRKHFVDKCLSPRRAKESETANEYLLYRRGKDKNNVLERLNE